MMKYFYLLLALLSVSPLFSQEYCNELLRDGEQFYSKHEYDKAKYNFIQLKNNCSIYAREAEEWIRKCEEKLKNQSNEAAKTIKKLQIRQNELERQNHQLLRERDSLLALVATLEHRQEKVNLRGAEKRAKEILTFKDPAFQQFLLKYYDQDLDGKISRHEAEGISKLDMEKCKLSSLEGIKHFVNLRILVCSNNPLYSLDLTHNTALEQLVCNNAKLTKLNISSCDRLLFLNCSGNKLPNLNLKHNTRLSTLYCQKNLLTALVLPDSVKYLECQRNNLTSLSLSRAVEYLNCTNNQLSALDLSHCPYLKTLICFSNQLTQLDVGMLQNLQFLDCRFNPKLQSLKYKQGQRMGEWKHGKKTTPLSY